MKKIIKTELSEESCAKEVTLEEKTALTPPHYYVGIGASAGGLEAIESFFTHMPADSGLAFIVIQHLSPNYKSLMVELLSQKTSMRVLRAEESMPVEADTVYLIPPKQNLSMSHGRLFLKEQENLRGFNLPIDVFLRSLAEDKGEQAVAIILSGTGSDGTRGVRAIKEHGGMVMVQDEKTARFDGMPRAAISTGLADFVLPPSQMPGQLKAYLEHPCVNFSKPSETAINNKNALTRLFSLLRERTKVDFTFYKPTTIYRRIERRMMVNQIHEFEDYVRYLVSYPGEVVTLYRELLIGVTSFFRDPEAMEYLGKEIMPDLLDRIKGREIRFWVTGCSTGEEAYTLAILAREAMELLGLRKDIKIFATDIDRDAVLKAGNGIYPESITADMTSDLLAKYFYCREDSYQIVRNVREMVVFAQHNLIKDPPFIKIDLISCRNLLIYLQPVLQKKAMEMFNFSLNPLGYLYLGSSETIGEMTDYFELIHQKFKIYRCKGKFLPLSKELMITSDEKRRFGRYGRSEAELSSRRSVAGSDRMIDRYLEVLPQYYAPLSVIVNEQMEVLHVIGNAEKYFKVPSGRVVYDITKMAEKDLAIPLSTGIQKAFRNGEKLTYTNIILRCADENCNLRMRIIPLPDRKGHDSLVAVFFDEIGVSEKKAVCNEAVYDVGIEIRQRIQDLEQELQFARENLQATIEELETSNEELQATNEELLASNEELQSTNEELQSTNEELHSVNSEYQSKIIELTELNNDVENLLTHSEIGSLLLDENLEIRKYSPEITKLFNVVESDVGRPLRHLSHQLEAYDPVDAALNVQATNQKIEEEVKATTGHWYLVRISPYQIGPNTYSGVVLTFVDISEQKQIKDALSRSERRYRRLFKTMAQGVVYQDLKGRIISANPSALKILGLTLEQMNGRTSMDPRWKAVKKNGTPLDGSDHPSMVALKTGRPVYGYIMGVFNPQMQETRWLLVNAIPEKEEGTGVFYQVFTTFEDVTNRILYEKRLEELQMQN